VDPALQERTFNLIQSSVRNQDLIYFFRGLATNTKAIIPLREFFESNYNSVSIRLLS
jgi:aminopeptidase 2